MKIVLQRVLSSKIIVEEKVVGEINKGLLIFLGFCKEDINKNFKNFIKVIHKLLKLRIFEDENQKMNLSVIDIEGEILVVSQFTLCGDPYQGNRPSFTNALEPSKAKEFYENFLLLLRQEYQKLYHERYQKIPKNLIQSGIFQKDMKVHLINDGPVTFFLEY